jgi:O-antigen/teichoic acid export membrane protein
MVTISLNQAWAPIYYDTARKGEAAHRTLGKICSAIVIVLVGIACVGALFARDFIAHFLDKRYATAERLVPWIIGAYLMHSLFSMFSLAALQARRTKVILGASFLALVLNTLLNFALIPKWGMYGATYATFLAYVVEAVVMYLLAQRIFRLEYDLSRTFTALAIFAVVLAVTQFQLSAPMRPFVMVATATVSLGLLAALGLNRETRNLRLRN